MAMTNAEHQRRYRERRNELARRALALEAEGAAPPIPMLPASQCAAVVRAIGLEITKARGRIAGLQRKRGTDAAQERRDLERTVAFWRAVLAGQGLEAAVEGSGLICGRD